MSETMSKGQRAAQDVATLLRARCALLWIVTREEGRAERLIVEACASAGYAPAFWDCADGITDLGGKPMQFTDGTNAAEARDPQVCLRGIRGEAANAARPVRTVWIMRDLPGMLRDPFTLRSVRSLARYLPTVKRDAAQALIVLTPSSEVPPELAGHVQVIEWPLPDRGEVAAILDSTIAALPADLQESAAPNGTRDAAIDAAVGLSAEEVASCYARSLVSTRRIDPASVAQDKRRVISRERVLEWIDPLPGGLDAVGGLDALKAWLQARRAAFTPAARAFGLPAPKGALLVGVPGCGKSLTAKAIATAWGMPLLRLDPGALKSKWVGESEGNLRKALKVAEAVSPCVLWVDEIEKALGGATQGAADGGVSADALGTLLSFMQERAGAVFVVATANNVESLPPELLRKGRFDDLFFVDLPTRRERMDVLAAALRAHGREPKAFDLGAVADACPEFTGSEVAALVPDALFAAFADDARPLSSEDLTRAAASVVPLARTASDKIRKLRDWAAGRARPATTPDAPSASAASARTLDL